MRCVGRMCCGGSRGGMLGRWRGWVLRYVAVADIWTGLGRGGLFADLIDWGRLRSCLVNSRVGLIRHGVCSRRRIWRWRRESLGC